MPDWNRKKKIAEIRENHSAGQYDYNYEIRDAIQLLLDELDKRDEENQKLREELHKFQELAIKAANRHKAERNKLIEVLRWYADKTNYVQEVHHLRHGTLIGPAEAIYYDDGQRARNILREIGVTVE